MCFIHQFVANLLCEWGQLRELYIWVERFQMTGQGTHFDSVFVP